MSPVDQGNLLQKMLHNAAHQSLISFTAGFPSTDFFQLESIREAYQQVLNEKHILQYTTDLRGDLSLREQISQRLKGKNMPVSPNDILLTTGSSQAMDLTARVLLSRGDVVLVENPTYQEALKLFYHLGANVVTVKSDIEGMDIADLQAKINQYNPKFIYVNATFCNPSGKTWSLERRQALLNTCRNFNLPILEDDPYGDLTFHKEDEAPTIYSLDTDSDSPIVIYVSTFSKTIAPALRVGYAVANPEILGSFIHTKALTTISSSTVDQKAISYFLQHNDFDNHLTNLKREYEFKCNLMVTELTTHFGNEFSWVKPKGGIYLWIKLPDYIDEMELLNQSIQDGVSYFPGQFFYVEEPDIKAIRLNFTYPTREQIVKGLQKFASAYRKVLSNKVNK